MPVRILRPAATILLGVALTACTSVPLFQDPAADRFAQLLNAPPADREEILQDLQINYPGSPWTLRGDALRDMYQQQKDLNRQIKRLESKASRCQARAQQLEQENSRLEEDLEKLKQLVIEMELRATP